MSISKDIIKQCLIGKLTSTEKGCHFLESYLRAKIANKIEIVYNLLYFLKKVSFPILIPSASSVT